MGLGGIKSAWQRQTKDFGHDQKDKYSCLILDNRGMGESDKPLMRYSTSDMARDVVEILDHIKWTQKRSIHVVGVSMGGMISQELALMIPERISSLCLVSTGPRIRNTVVSSSLNLSSFSPFRDSLKTYTVVPCSCKYSHCSKTV
jgi:pimeloyl-ACP methyl ester carboxylesterase